MQTKPTWHPKFSPDANMQLIFSVLLLFKQFSMPFTPLHEIVLQPGSRILELIVLRASRSRCAWAASLS
jgi:hypothetical protein